MSSIVAWRPAPVVTVMTSARLGDCCDDYEAYCTSGTGFVKTHGGVSADNLLLFGL